MRIENPKSLFCFQIFKQVISTNSIECCVPSSKLVHYKQYALFSKIKIFEVDFLRIEKKYCFHYCFCLKTEANNEKLTNQKIINYKL